MINKLNKIESLPKLFDKKCLGKEEWEERKMQIEQLLADNIYGRVTVSPDSVSYEILSENPYIFAGKAAYKQVKLSFSFGEITEYFTVDYIVPNVKNPPVFVCPNFRKPYPDSFIPFEEVIDRGIGIATFFYQDVALDSNEAFDSRLGKVLAHSSGGGRYTGTISMWAWACSRVADFLYTQDNIDLENLAVIGHSRLGKTALVCGSRDERFKFTFVNNSGCAGDALLRATDDRGEHISAITKSFSYWFTPKYSEYKDREDELPVDQHFLVSLIAPRYVCGGLAEEDVWAGLNAQYYSYILASPAWEVYDKKGLIHPDRDIAVGDSFLSGEAGIFMRANRHYLSRYDWNKYIDFFEKHSGKK